MPPATRPRSKSSRSKSNMRNLFSEADRAIYEQKLADCNGNLASLRQTVKKYKIHNETLQNAYDQLDEDRADIIEYLKKTLNLSIEENSELKKKVTSLEELREIEIAEFQVTVDELERNFSRMEVQLTSENKLQSGKLNTLEELRAIREDLMTKFEKQEHAFEEQAKKYKIIIYETEKQLVIGKQNLKKEMEGRIQQLAQEFQDASEMRIAASTHNVIQENITLNNQLDSLLMTQAKIAQQNEKLREDERAARCAMEVAEEVRAEAVNKSIMQLKHIDHLTAEFENVSKKKAIYDKNQFDTEKMQVDIQRLSKANEKLSLKVRALEQNLNATLGDQNKSVVETAKLLRERNMFKNILKESTFAVQAALKMDHLTTLDPSCEIIDREIVLKRILEVIHQYRDAVRAESKESLISFSNIYEKGDLGFDVKPVSSKKSQALIEAAGSFEDKRSSISVSSPLSPSKESLKTITSIELMPEDSQGSFTITSLHSSYSLSTVKSEESEGDLIDVSKLLTVSRDEIFTQKLSGVDSKSRISTGSQKSILSGKGRSGDIRGEHHKTIPEEDESKHVQDKGELTMVEQDDEADNKKKETSAE